MKHEHDYVEDVLESFDNFEHVNFDYEKALESECSNEFFTDNVKKIDDLIWDLDALASPGGFDYEDPYSFEGCFSYLSHEERLSVYLSNLKK